MPSVAIEIEILKLEPFPSIARISDILEQIGKLNQMIDFHKNESGEKSMQRQYEEMKQRFVEELSLHLAEFDIDVKIKGETA